MAKKDKKNAKKDKARDPSDVVDAVRGAVERTFQATSGGTDAARDRGRSLLDDVANAAQRIRESFDDLRVLEDVRGLRAEIEALSRRVAELEKASAKPARATAGRSTSARSTSARSTPARSTTARKAPAKPSAAGTAARTTGTAKPKPAAAKPAAAKPAAAEPAAAKPAPSRRTAGTSRKS